MTPSFREKCLLVRYIHPTERQNDNHAAASAFLLGDDEMGDSAAHLSVNANEIESRSVIARYFADVFQDGIGPVAMCTHQVIRYVGECRNVGLPIAKANDPPWEFSEEGTQRPAFRHRKVQPFKRSETGSASHCGVEFVRALTDTQRRKFARRMAREPRFHLLDP